jgi:acyl dehydratase
VSGGVDAGLNAALAGKDLGVRRYEVTAEAIGAFARATEDDNPRYASGSDPIAGPVWPVVPAFESFMAAARDPELGADLRRLLHLSEEHRLLRPIRPGDVLTVRAVLEAVAPHAGGEAFTVAARELDARGELVAEVWGTMLIRGRGTGTRPAPAAPAGEVVHAEATTIAEDQMRRYADASGDHNPIHKDAELAKNVGLPGIIVHGMCTLAFACWAAVENVCDGDPTKLKRCAGRFSRPVLPGQELETAIWAAGEQDGRTVHAFETQGPDGPVVRNGVAEPAKKCRTGSPAPTGFGSISSTTAGTAPRSSGCTPPGSTPACGTRGCRSSPNGSVW